MRIVNKASLRMVSYGLSISFLLVHILLFMIFWNCKVWPMVIMNCFSIPFYAFSILLIRRDIFRLYLELLYFEVLIHMFLAIYYTGWYNGFQIPLLSMYIVAFTGEYLARTVDLPRPHALVLSLIAMVEYIALFILSSVHTAPYTLPDSYSYALQIMWAVLIFSIGSICLFYFVHVATTSEIVLAKEAERDKLTGLYNRAGYEKIFSGLNASSIAMLVADADRFKSINDTYGHKTGDRVLKRIADILTHTFRSDDYISRIGGDEFVVLMKTNPEMTENTIHRKITRINSELLHPKDGLPPVSISVGVAFGRECASADELFNDADQALYQVKEAGGRDCAIFRR